MAEKIMINTNFESRVRIQKRDGELVSFDRIRILNAITKCINSYNQNTDIKIPGIISTSILFNVLEDLSTQSLDKDVFKVDDIQETVIKQLGLINENLSNHYMRYKLQREKERREKYTTGFSNLIKSAKENDNKKENANIDGNTSMGTMLHFGSFSAKEFTLENLLPDHISKAHNNGTIHIHDMDFYPMGTTTCCQIDLQKLFKGGFHTGHGYIREPQKIETYAALTAIAIQSNQNDQHGGQSINAFDKDLAPGVEKSLYKNLKSIIKKVLKYNYGIIADCLDEVLLYWGNDLEQYKLNIQEIFENELKLISYTVKSGEVETITENILQDAILETEEQTLGAMESLVHNLNTMHSRAGSQVPFSSINFGTDTSWSGRMVSKSLLEAQYKGLGNGETPIFPILIFKVKEGVNFNQTDKNYDLYKLAMKVSAKRLFPNFAFLDAPFNLQFYKEDNFDSEVAYMGCRTRTIANKIGEETVNGRGNVSFTSINLPRIGIKTSVKGKVKNKWNKFYKELDEVMELTAEQLLLRLEYQGKRTRQNFPFLMDGIWRDSERLNNHEPILNIIKHGSLSIGFIGLAETLKVMTGYYHCDNEETRNKGLEIVKFMRNKCDELSNIHGLNFALIATPAEGLSGRFLKIDKKLFGEIEGVTDRDYYTNSFHVPVFKNVSIVEKIKIEAPYHNLTNGGHISYVELDGDPSENYEVYESILKHMKESGIGYGSINHPIDRDPVCGYTGIIKDECPKCGRHETEDVPFERIRRITGYLVGTLDRFNNAKKKEVDDRVKHS